jgi:hypothetical protein
MSTSLADRGFKSNHVILVADNAVQQEISQTASPKKQMRIAHSSDRAGILYNQLKSSSSFQAIVSMGEFPKWQRSLGLFCMEPTMLENVS